MLRHGLSIGLCLVAAACGTASDGGRDGSAAGASGGNPCDWDCYLDPDGTNCMCGRDRDSSDGCSTSIPMPHLPYCPNSRTDEVQQTFYPCCSYGTEDWGDGCTCRYERPTPTLCGTTSAEGYEDVSRCPPP